MNIAENIARVRSEIPEGRVVELVAVSKTRPVETIMEAYDAGQRVFGENRPQEMATKQAALAALPNPPADIRWHMIGHLQTNKVKLIAPFVELIHSADSARLLHEISRQAGRLGRVIDVLLEIHVAREESKSGWQPEELVAWLEGGEWRELTGVRFRGVMGIATFTDDEATVRAEFERLAAMHATLRDRFFFPRSNNCPCGSHFSKDFDIISMGMSDDYPIAIECGSTMVRIGSLIFGSRN